MVDGRGQRLPQRTDVGDAQDELQQRWRPRDAAARYRRDQIKAHQTPAVIGTGWLKHYPLAIGYAYQERIVRKCVIVCWDEVVYDRSFLR